MQSNSFSFSFFSSFISSFSTFLHFFLLWLLFIAVVGVLKFLKAIHRPWSMLTLTSIFQLWIEWHNETKGQKAIAVKIHLYLRNNNSLYFSVFALFRSWITLIQMQILFYFLLASYFASVLVNSCSCPVKNEQKQYETEWKEEFINLSWNCMLCRISRVRVEMSIELGNDDLIE